MLDIYELLHHIEQKPGMYIGNQSISNLYMFLNGYQFARRQLNIPLSLQEEQFRQFQPWLQDNLNIQTSTSWSEVILSITNDEKAAFEQFYSYFQTFLQEKRQPVTTNGNGAVTQ